MKSLSWHCRLLLGCTIAGLAPGVWAQQAATTTSADDALTEVVVTAEKREEKLQDVPVAVTVVGAQQLADQHVYSIADLSRTAPALEMIQSFGGPGGGGQIRGIGTQSFTRSAEGAVGVVVDGVSQGNLNTSNIFDTQRVEVLRGPQGTLFGLTSSAGVINMVTNAPDPSKFESIWHIDFANKGTAGSEFGQDTIHGVVNLPVSDNSALRFSGSLDDNKGVQHNSYTGKDDTANNYSLRGRYLWRGSDLEVNVIADYQRTIQDGVQGGGLPGFTYVYADPALTAELAACGITPGFGNQDRCANHSESTNDTNYGLSSQLDWDLGSSTLTSISAYRRDENGPGNSDIQAVPTESPQIWATGALASSRQFSEELRISSKANATAEYTAGLFYSNYLAWTYPAAGAFFHLQPLVGPPELGSPTTALTQTSSRSEAAFGQLTFHSTDQLAFIAGLRLTRETISDYNSPTGLVPGTANNAGSSSQSLQQNNVSGKLGVQYKFTPQWTGYLTGTRGYKGPQAQSATTTTPAVLIPAEIPLSFELGLKGSTADNKLSVDFSLFDTRVQNYQGQTCTLNPVGILVCVPNSFDVTTRGVELDLYGQPLPHLSLTGGFIYDEAKYPSTYTGLNPNDLVPGATTSMGGLQLVGVPKDKLTLSADYSIPLSATTIVLGGDTVYKSDVRYGYSADPRYVYPAHWVVGLHAGIRGSDDRWGVSVFGRDLNNAHEPITIFGGPAFSSPLGIGPPFFFNPAYPNGQVSGISGWVGMQSLREVGISGDLRF